MDGVALLLLSLRPLSQGGGVNRGLVDPNDCAQYQGNKQDAEQDEGELRPTKVTLAGHHEFSELPRSAMPAVLFP